MTLRRASEGIRWPALNLCQERRAGEDPDCVCRTYEGAEGYYVLEDTGHAVAYYRDRADAVKAAEAPQAAPGEAA